MVKEKIAQMRDPATIDRMMDYSAFRAKGADDIWHVLCAAKMTRSWWGTRIVKYEIDLARFFHLIHDTRPEVILETGLQSGGSAIFFLDVCDILALHRTMYIGIDIAASRTKELIERYRTYNPYFLVSNDCLADATIREVEPLLKGKRSLVVLDSVHSEQHVTEELRLYAPLLSPGSHLVVADTDHSGHPILANYGPSSWHAVEKFMAKGGLGQELGFVHDEKTEAMFARLPGVQPFTESPRGWLVKK